MKVDTLRCQEGHPVKDLEECFRISPRQYIPELRVITEFDLGFSVNCYTCNTGYFDYQCKEVEGESAK